MRHKLFFKEKYENFSFWNSQMDLGEWFIFFSLERILLTKMSTINL